VNLFQFRLPKAQKCSRVPAIRATHRHMPDGAILIQCFWQNRCTERFALYWRSTAQAFWPSLDSNCPNCRAKTRSSFQTSGKSGPLFCCPAPRKSPAQSRHQGHSGQPPEVAPHDLLPWIVWAACPFMGQSGVRSRSAVALAAYYSALPVADIYFWSKTRAGA